MAVTVRRAPQFPLSADLKTAKPASSLRVAQPIGATINYCVGHLLGGQRHFQVNPGSLSETDGVARIYTYRHPDCDHVDVIIRITDYATQSGFVLTVQAGSGTAYTVPNGYIPRGAIFCVRVPWDASDSGDQEVTVTYQYLTLGMLAVYDVPRRRLVSGDNRIENRDGTYFRIGLGAEQMISESALAGTKGMIQEVIDAWDNYNPQVFSWWAPDGAPLSVSATSFGGKGSSSDFFGGVTFQHRCRQKKDADTVRDTRWWLRTYGAGTVTGYTVKVSTSVGSDSVTAARTNTSAAWGSVLSGVAMAADQDDTFVIEAIRTGGTGNIYLEAVSGIEESS